MPKNSEDWASRVARKLALEEKREKLARETDRVNELNPSENDVAGRISKRVAEANLAREIEALDAAEIAALDKELEAE